MTTDILLVFAILAATIALFISDKLRLDLVALMSLLALSLTGLVTPGEALAGFSDSVVIMIAGLFVVSGGLFQTGVASRLGLWLGKFAGTSEFRLVGLVMLMSAFLSGFMSSTGTVAVMLPITVSLAWGAGLSPSKLLIPLAFGSLLGGMLTLIGTPPNIVASNQLAAAELPPFQFFDYTLPGLAMLIVGLAFMLFIGRHLLPSRAPAAPKGGEGDALSLGELADTYKLHQSFYRLKVPAASPLVGKSLSESDLRQRYGVTVVSIEAGNGSVRRSRSLEPSTRFAAGDAIFVQGRTQDIDEMVAGEGLESLPLSPDDKALLPQNLGLVEVLLTPRSRLIGQTLKDARFRDRYRVTVLSMRRLSETLTEGITTTPLRFGDTLLVKGPWKHIDLLRDEHRDFVVVAEPRELNESRLNTARAPWAVIIMLGMLLMMTFNVVPNVTAVLIAAVAMVLAGCLSMNDAYRSINWESVVLIAAILPMATALENTGGMQLIVDSLGGLGAAGPMVMMAAIFLLTSIFSQVISNTATTVLVAPIALQTALNLGVSPYPFMMTVALAASTAFLTPIASPVNTLVLGPGNYRFGDFFKVGIILQVLTLIITLLVVPLLFPL